MKVKTNESPPTIHFPPNAKLAISLIKEELRNLKFINDLYKTGVDATTGLLDFSGSILEIMGFESKLADELSEWYYNQQNKLVKNIDINNEEDFKERAFSFYIDLLVRKREWDERNN